MSHTYKEDNSGTAAKSLSLPERQDVELAPPADPQEEQPEAPGSPEDQGEPPAVPPGEQQDKPFAPDPDRKDCGLLAAPDCVTRGYGHVDLRVVPGQDGTLLVGLKDDTLIGGTLRDSRPS